MGGRVARNANIVYVYSVDAIFSVFYAVDQNFAPIISLASAYANKRKVKPSLIVPRTVAQQANAQGITWLAATGRFWRRGL